jgi:hypothetical protein
MEIIIAAMVIGSRSMFHQLRIPRIPKNLRQFGTVSVQTKTDQQRLKAQNLRP